MTPQDEFDFSAQSEAHGYNCWLDQRKQALIALAQKLHMPLNHQVEVWLAGGIRLRGKLQLQEEKLFLPEDDFQRVGFRVDYVPFSIHEMESCVRTD